MFDHLDIEHAFPYTPDIKLLFDKGALVMYMGIKQLLHCRVHRSDVIRYALIALVGAALAVAIVYEMAPCAAASSSPTEVVVHEGDTLWGLAQTYGPPHADPRRTISRIQEINHLTGSLIRPGEVVLIPQA